MRVRSGLPAIVLLILAAPAAAQQVLPAGEARPWRHEAGDLESDPRIRWIGLDHGLRLAWAENKEPNDRVYLRLHVDVGSLAEAEGERGLAHFLEHMAFNGLRDFAAGTLIEWFQEHGMSFGADTNAHTGFSETVYKLDLPSRDAEALREGLTVLRNFADGMLLAEAEVQAEKGVIDGEERERDSGGLRAALEAIRRQYAGSRLAERIPIGVREDRDAFNAARVRAFYERWYRPELMTVVIVGDLRGLDPEPLVREVFAGLRAPQEPVAHEPAAGAAEDAERFFAVREPDLPQARVTLAVLKPWSDRPDARAEREREALESMAARMLDLRYSEKAKLADTPYLAASAGRMDGLRVWDGGELTVVADPERWDEAFRAAYLDLRAALNWGFQEAELAEVRADWLRALDEAVEREATAPSAGLRESILAAVEDGVAPLSAAQERDLLRPLIESATTERCLDALRELWRGGEASLTLVGPEEIERDEERLETLYQKCREAKPEKPAELARAEFAYPSAADAAGVVLRRAEIEDLGLTVVGFANGAMLNLKRTDFSERQILTLARVGEGMLGFDDEELVTISAGAAGLGQAGLEAHSADDLRRIFAGRQAGWTAGVEEDHCSFSGGTTSEDLLAHLELLCATLTHPGWREDGLTLFQKQVPMIRQALRTNPIGPMVTEFMPVYLDHQQRLVLFGQFGPLPPLERMESVRMSELGALLAGQWAAGPLELTVVGDFDVEATIAAAARTIGALPQRRARIEVPERRAPKALPRGLEMRRTVQTGDEKSQLWMFFPTPDGRDPARRRALSVLGLVVDDRLRLEVRERLGAAYSPGAAVDASRVYQGFGALMIAANSAPEGADVLIEACRGVAKTLAEEGVGAEEVHRLVAPVLSQVRDQRRNNAYWLRELAQAQSDPASLENPRTVIDFYHSVDAGAISALAAEILHPGAESFLLVLPE